MLLFYLFLFLILWSFLCSYLRKKYVSPYTLTHIFGKKGSGKSCLMVREMLKHQRRGWKVYTDIQDIKIPGVRVITVEGLKSFVPDADSLLCLDECGISFDNRGFKNFDVGYRDFFKLQRKHRIKVLMNSQSFDVDSKIRDVVDRMILQTNILGCISVSRPIKITMVPTDPVGDKESRIATKLKFESVFHWRIYWMPKYFKYFDSFAAPEREPIAYREIPGYVPSRSLLKRIERRLNK